MQWTKWSGLLLLCFYHFQLQAQVTGGQSSFEYLRLSDAPHISALGSICVSNPDNDIAFALQNPALMRPDLHNQLGLNYNSYYSGIGIMNLQYGYHLPDIKTSFVLGVQYLNYGDFTQTDELGNEYGNFKASDYALTLGASRSYGENWRYGAALKWAHSTLYDKSGAALLVDVGVNYMDTASLVDIGIVAKNMGVTVKKYNPAMTAEPLPFDLQIGISKRFKHLPLRLIATIHHLYEWDVRYDNPADIQQNNLTGTADTAKSSSNFADNLFRHFIFGAELTLAKRLTISAAYNDLRRQELVIKDNTGLAGFSFGLGLNLNKFQIHYARNYYYIGGAYNEIGLNITLNKLFGLGKPGAHNTWSPQYPEWQ